MPISGDEFDHLDEEESDPISGTDTAEILLFLESNADKAFTQSEIAEETDVTRESVGPKLVQLWDRGCVDHRKEYWCISDHERSLDDSVNHASAVVASHEEESFDYKSWQEHTVDPRENHE